MAPGSETKRAIPSDYRQVLTRILRTRLRKNAAYSLTAFARDLGLSRSSLSLILDGKQGLSAAKAQQIARRLKFSVKETELFVNLVRRQHARTEHLRERAAETLEENATVPMRIVTGERGWIPEASWRHFAVRELTNLPDFRKNPEWIAERLGLSVADAQRALEDCVRAEWITQDQISERWVATDYLNLGSGLPLKNLHRGLLEKMTKVFESEAPENRDVSFVFFTVTDEQYQRATELMKKFRRELAATLQHEDREAKTRVVCLANQLFPVTRVSKD